MFYHIFFFLKSNILKRLAGGGFQNFTVWSECQTSPLAQRLSWFYVSFWAADSCLLQRLLEVF